MNVHENARMTVHGRVLLVMRAREQGWRVAAAAVAAGVSERTAYKWLARHRHRLPAEVGAAIERLRRHPRLNTHRQTEQPPWK